MLPNKVANNVTKAVNAMNSPEISKEEKKLAMRERSSCCIGFISTCSRIKLRISVHGYGTTSSRDLFQVVKVRWYDTVLLSVLLGFSSSNVNFSI